MLMTEFTDNTMKREMPCGTHCESNAPFEREIVAVWRQVLGIDGPIPVTANFFALGGHSLLATQIISRLNKTFAIRLPLQHFLAEPTVEGLALLVKERRLMKAMISDVETATARNTSLEREEFTL